MGSVSTAGTLAVCALVLAVSAGVGPGSVGSRSGALGGIDATPAAPLSANLTYSDRGGSWNCGQGHQAFEFFGGVQGGLAPYRYNWTFGDGSVSSNVSSPTHTYSRFGQFVVNVSVEDTAGKWVNASVTPVWGIPLTCSSSSDLGMLGVFGIALYAVLLVAIVLGVVLVIRVRRRRSPP